MVIKNESNFLRDDGRCDDQKVAHKKSFGFLCVGIRSEGTRIVWQKDSDYDSWCGASELASALGRRLQTWCTQGHPVSMQKV